MLFTKPNWVKTSSLKLWVKKFGACETIGISFLPPQARAFGVAMLYWSLKSPLVIHLPSVREQEELAGDLEAWGIPTVLFPELAPSVEGAVVDPDVAAERFQILKQLRDSFSGVLVMTQVGAEQTVIAPDHMKAKTLQLAAGMEINRDEVLNRLLAAGYTREVQVQGRGQFAVRGGIVDLFSWDAEWPVRLEWMGDELESLRHFHTATQCSVDSINECDIWMDGAPSENQEGDRIEVYYPKGHRLVLVDEPVDDPEGVTFLAHGLGVGGAHDAVLQEQSRKLLWRQVAEWIDADWTVVCCSNNEAESKRWGEIMRENAVLIDSLIFEVRPILRGFIWTEQRLVVLADAEVFSRYQTARLLKKRETLNDLRSAVESLDWAAIPEGTLVVHRHHGIARYRGMKSIPGDEKAGEVLVLEFDAQARLYVTLDQVHLVSRYIGIGKSEPDLDVLGGARWEKARGMAEKATLDYAAHLLRVQAEREAKSGFAFPPDTPWQSTFEEAFLYEETRDQIRAIEAVKQDMEQIKPMDRLICGDVGFGKTEVAIRAIFKAVMSGRQAAFLVPTTVLARQHWTTLRERFADFPIRVEMLSRFTSPKATRDILEGLSQGSVDVVVGTHRLITGDVIFKQLGLVVIDEEQRFGVRQKDKFKELFRQVDILTLSATPIPRTLYLALTGMRDMSTIETPPPRRHAVETIVCPYDEKVIREAIRRELARSGQIFFLHNRIATLEKVAERLRFLVPEARVGIGHGRMDKAELEEVMERFVSGAYDILLSTTIIESGIDIPNANTLFIDRADRFGLADLYQLRGRVGRAHHKAYAYLLLPREMMGIAEARKRVNAIRQYSELGSGFKIAMRDLEIRGAGNILGTAQSGHITAVGFELYCQLLKKAVSQLKGERAVNLVECRLDLDFICWQENAVAPGRSAACLPVDYMPESSWRLEGYRRLADVSRPEHVDVLEKEWRDRFGPLPEPTVLLLWTLRIKTAAAAKNIDRIEVQDGKLMMRRGGDYLMIEGRFPRLTVSFALPRLQHIYEWIISLA